MNKLEKKNFTYLNSNFPPVFVSTLKCFIWTLWMEIECHILGLKPSKNCIKNHQTTMRNKKKAVTFHSMHLSLLKSFANHKWTHISTFFTWQKYVGKYVLPNLHCFAFSWFTWFVPDFQMSPMKGNSIKEEVNYTFKKVVLNSAKVIFVYLKQGIRDHLYIT